MTLVAEAVLVNVWEGIAIVRLMNVSMDEVEVEFAMSEQTIGEL